MATLAEREARRESLRNRALAQAARIGRTPRCWQAAQYTDQSDPLVIAEHRFCRGEEPGGAGCLCTCHDPREAS